jgi:hypothetical protein
MYDEPISNFTYIFNLRPHFEVVSMLLNAGADENTVTSQHETTALYIAQLNGHLGVVEVLSGRSAQY